jgi:hypothetical protein
MTTTTTPPPLCAPPASALQNDIGTIFARRNRVGEAMGWYRSGIECAMAALPLSSSSAPSTRWWASLKNDYDNDAEGGDADNDNATLIVPSSPPNDDNNDNDDDATENCGIGRIDNAGRGSARVTAEAGVGPGLAWFRRKCCGRCRRNHCKQQQRRRRR